MYKEAASAAFFISPAVVLLSAFVPPAGGLFIVLFAIQLAWNGCVFR
jgi:hypothetical protein